MKIYRKNIVFYSNDYHGIDLVFKDYLIKTSRKFNFNPIIILTNIFSNKQNNAKEIFNSYKDYAEIYFLSDLSNSKIAEHFYNILDSKKNTLLLKIFRKLIVILKFFLSFNIKKKLKKIINYKSVCAILASNNQNKFIDKIEYDFYKLSSSSNKKFIGSPIVGWPTLHQKIIYPFDYFLTSTLKDKFRLKKNCRTIFIGCLSFEDKKQKSIKVSKKNVYISMVNIKNLFYKDFNITDYTEKLITFLLNKDYVVNFKNHPRTPFETLKFEKEKNFIICNKNIKNLNFNPDFVISFLSSSLLESVSNEFKTIMLFPDTLIEKIEDNQHIYKDMYYDFSQKTPTLIRYCAMAKNLGEVNDILNGKVSFDQLNKNFKKDFWGNGSSKRLLKIL